MDLSEYTYLLNKPNAINYLQMDELDKIINKFPYFQSARTLQLKGFFNKNSFKYNEALKQTAAHTSDRSVLFLLITSDNFVGIQKGFFEQQENNILNISVLDSILVENKNSDLPIVEVKNTLEESILLSIEKSEPKIAATKEIIDVNTDNNILEIGKPLFFEKNEKHSFQEWLQLSQVKPIVRLENNSNVGENSSNLSSKLDIIDKFIENNPKISPVKKNAEMPSQPLKTEDNSYLMTETLAKVYLEQKKYAKAIQAFEILILKYPEKNTFFADRISAIKELQKNNS